MPNEGTGNASTDGDQEPSGRSARPFHGGWQGPHAEYRRRAAADLMSRRVVLLYSKHQRIKWDWLTNMSYVYSWETTSLLTSSYPWKRVPAGSRAPPPRFRVLVSSRFGASACTGDSLPSSLDRSRRLPSGPPPGQRRSASLPRAGHPHPSAVGGVAMIVRRRPRPCHDHGDRVARRRASAGTWSACEPSALAGLEQSSGPVWLNAWCEGA